MDTHTISVHYDTAGSTLMVSGHLENNPTQRATLESIFSKLARQKRKITIDTENLSVIPSALEMWIELTEKLLPELEVHYLYSQLSMLMGYNDDLAKSSGHIFDLEPPPDPSEVPSGRHAW